MRRTKVQIYEIQTPEEARAMAELGVDTVGSVIVSPDIWKQEILKDAIAAAREAGAQTSLIPLFSDLETVCKVLDFYSPDIVHFCETLTGDSGSPVDLEGFVSLQEAVRKRFPNVRIMRSIPIARPGLGHLVPTLEIARALEPASDLFLTDTWLGKGSGPAPSDPVQGFIGITGMICDWDLAAALAAQSRIPVILAGGISPENVCDGILAVRPHGVDSCTRTNVLDSLGKPVRFKKDQGKVRVLLEETARADTIVDGMAM